MQDLESEETSDGAGDRKIANRKLSGSTHGSGASIGSTYQTGETGGPMLYYAGSRMSELIHGTSSAAAHAPLHLPRSLGWLPSFVVYLLSLALFSLGLAAATLLELLAPWCCHALF